GREVLGSTGFNDQIASMTIELPPADDTEFSVRTPCGGAAAVGPEVSIPFYDNCDVSPFPVVGRHRMDDTTYTIVERGVELDDMGSHIVNGTWEVLSGPEVRVSHVNGLAAVSAAWGSA